ncbi:MAG TPA: M20/M25/M40 family metallo-hydrolase [Pyrinomonadaceae bacterium]|nr:M20/M25/M40 family metallo-hydrolase [Pyrinomonadaceae bacterium]
MKKILRAFSFALLFAFAVSAQVSQIEKKIVEAVEKNNDAAISLLEKTVNIESPTENVKGVKEVGMIFKKELDALGFQTKWLDLPAEMKRAGHLIAERKGGKGKTVLLLGHLDTVLSGEKFRRDGKIAYGTGTADMKSGDIVLLFALKALAEADALKDANIIVFLTGDEENAAEPIETARRDMVEAAKRSDLVLSFENGGNGIATVARRGISDWMIEVTAKTGHSSAIFKDSMGNGAIFEASRILNQFYEQLRGEKYLTFNPGLIVGGTTADAPDHNGNASGKTNVVAAKAIIRGDIRFISKAQEEAARAKMREIVSKNLGGTSAKISFVDGIPAMAPTDANYELLKKLDQVSQDLNLGKITALDPGERGAGDISFVTHLLPGLDGLGTSGGKTHAAGEYVELESLSPQTKRAALLIYRLTR